MLYENVTNEVPDVHVVELPAYKESIVEWLKEIGRNLIEELLNSLNT